MLGVSEPVNTLEQAPLFRGNSKGYTQNSLGISFEMDF